MKLTRMLALALILAMLPLAGCTSGAARVAEVTTNLTVVTSISPLADLIRNVVGTRATVINLVPVGGDPHDYDPKPADAAALAHAKVFFANGLSYEHYLDKLVKNAQNPDLRVVTLADGIKLVGKDETGSAANPHTWLNVQNAMTFVAKIRDTMVQVDPAGQATYEANAKAYLSTLGDLDKWVQAQVQTIPAAQRQLMVFHDAWPYFADRYGFQNLPLLENSEAEPSAKDYADMVNRIKTQKIPAVFGEAGFNPSLIKRLAGDTGVKYIDNLLDDTLAADADGNSYIKMIQYDTTQIVNALR